jgi:hypothetical protein
MSYAVLWSANGGPAHAGKLSFTPTGLVFEGAQGRTPSRLEVPYGAVRSAGIVRAPRERPEGPVAVLECETVTVRLSTVGGIGGLHEIVEQVNARGNRPHAVAVR